MKIKPFIFLIIVLLPASAVFSQTFSLTFFNNGKEYKISLKSSDLKNTPSWNAEKDVDIPLPIREAIEIGRKNLRRFIPDAGDKWSVRDIALNRAGVDKWFYEVDFECPQKACAVNARVFNFFVKMDGSVVEPTISLIPTTVKPKYPRAIFARREFKVYANGNEYKVTIGDRELKDAATWNPEKEKAPPLSIQRAIAAGRDNLNLFEPLADDNWTVQKIYLQQPAPDKWFYIIEFHCMPEECKPFDTGNSMFIKMDGTIIEPTVTPVTQITKP
jgi:hypothetical protein